MCSFPQLPFLNGVHRQTVDESAFVFTSIASGDGGNEDDKDAVDNSSPSLFPSLSESSITLNPSCSDSQIWHLMHIADPSALHLFTKVYISNNALN